MTMFDAAAALKKLGVPVRELCCDSRAINRQSVFVAYAGEQADGREHIAAALAAGASGVFWDPHNFSWPETAKAPNVAVPELRACSGLLADAVCGAPSQKLFTAAVTGTNGKTTIAHFAAQLLEQAGLPTGIVGTLGAGTKASALRPVANTTPEAIALHGYLRDFVNGGAQAAVLEASSHGIAQQRLAGVRLAAAVLANIGRDHFDYHGGSAQYQQVKTRLLTTPELPVAIVNADDARCVEAMRQLHNDTKGWTYGAAGDTLRLCSANINEDGQRLQLDGTEGTRTIELSVPGRHNALNFMAAALIARAAGVSWNCMRPQQLTLPRGRLQRVNPDTRPAVYVDYAHTPDALTAALAALQNRRGKLWLVFGCGGARDAGKRQLMGRTAARADVAIVTDDNPRTEAAAKIRAQVLTGGLHLREVAGRAAAIASAIEEAASDDTILIAGKGHEEYQEIDGVRRYFSDVATARSVLAARRQNSSGQC